MRLRILKANGPKGGKLEDVEAKLMLAAGVDIVALDAWGAEVMGQQAGGHRLDRQRPGGGLGKIDYRSLALREIAVS